MTTILLKMRTMVLKIMISNGQQCNISSPILKWTVLLKQIPASVQYSSLSVSVESSPNYHFHQMLKFMLGKRQQLNLYSSFFLYSSVCFCCNLSFFCVVKFSDFIFSCFISWLSGISYIPLTLGTRCPHCREILRLFAFHRLGAFKSCLFHIFFLFE